MTLEREREGNRLPPRVPDFLRSTIFALSLCAISSLFLSLALSPFRRCHSEQALFRLLYTFKLLLLLRPSLQYLSPPFDVLQVSSSLPFLVPLPISIPFLPIYLCPPRSSLIDGEAHSELSIETRIFFAAPSSFVPTAVTPSTARPPHPQSVRRRRSQLSLDEVRGR